MSHRVFGKSGFTLVEIMIVVAIIAMLTSIALPSIIRARKRSQGTAIKDALRLIDSGVDQYAIEFSVSTGVVAFGDVKRYLKPSSYLYNTGADVLGNAFGSSYMLGGLPSIPASSYAALSDYCDDSFWSPYPH